MKKITMSDKEINQAFKEFDEHEIADTDRKADFISELAKHHAFDW